MVAASVSQDQHQRWCCQANYDLCYLYYLCGHNEGCSVYYWDYADVYQDSFYHNLCYEDLISYQLDFEISVAPDCMREFLDALDDQD